MKKASHILGLIGGALALVCAAACIILGLLIALIAPSLASTIAGFLNGSEPYLPGLFSIFTQIGGIALIIVGLIMTAAGVLALVGAHHVNKHNVKAGVLMLAAAGLSLLTGYGWAITVLCVLGGVFALVKEKTPDAPQG